MLGADAVEQNHRMALGGDGVEFTNDPAPTVSPDEDIALVGVRSSSGLPGVLLIRGDGTSMAMYVFRDPSTTFGSVGFAPWVGMTLFGAADSTGSRIVAINNYARIQFQLDVQDHRGEITVAPDLSYVALLREQEIELVPLETPGQTTVIMQERGHLRALTSTARRWRSSRSGSRNGQGGAVAGASTATARSLTTVTRRRPGKTAGASQQQQVRRGSHLLAVISFR